MSITITGEFASPYDARQAAQRLRRRGYIVSASPEKPASNLVGDKLLVAYPFGAAGGNTIGNSILGAMPPMAENSVSTSSKPLVSVLTDDTQSAHARSLMESLGGHIL